MTLVFVNIKCDKVIVALKLYVKEPNKNINKIVLTIISKYARRWIYKVERQVIYVK